jgi:tetratricopeptide (TPR) repeat protein
MRHECSNCLSEFFDDATSGNALERVFCVFCGTPLAPPGEERASAVPFSADFQRDESFALGVIGRASSDFPDTLKQFRAHGAGAKPRNDSLSPVQTETEQPVLKPEVAPWRLRRFWTSLAIGFGVGAVAAAVVGQRTAARAKVVVAASAPVVAAPQPGAPSLALSGCPVPSAAPPVTSAAAVAAPKPPVTPVLEKRFWLERARAAQHQYRLADAERFYRRVLVQAPRDSEALAGVGEVELLRGAPLAADARFREALDANADYLPALIALADLHWQSGQAEDARGEYRNIVEHYSADLYPTYVSQRLEAEACVPQCQ